MPKGTVKYNQWRLTALYGTNRGRPAKYLTERSEKLAKTIAVLMFWRTVQMPKVVTF